MKKLKTKYDKVKMTKFTENFDRHKIKLVKKILVNQHLLDPVEFKFISSCVYFGMPIKELSKKIKVGEYRIRKLINEALLKLYESNHRVKFKEKENEKGGKNDKGEKND
jgi:hypothetical protein